MVTGYSIEVAYKKLVRLLNDIEEKIWYNIRRQAAAWAYQLNQAPSLAEVRRMRVLPAAGMI